MPEPTVYSTAVRVTCASSKSRVAEPVSTVNCDLTVQLVVLELLVFKFTTVSSVPVPGVPALIASSLSIPTRTSMTSPVPMGESWKALMRTLLVQIDVPVGTVYC